MRGVRSPASRKLHTMHGMVVQLLGGDRENGASILMYKGGLGDVPLLGREVGVP